MTPAHIGPIPLEELLPLVYGSGAAWLAAIRVRMRRRTRR
jgi:hypothetical protein